MGKCVSVLHAVLQLLAAILLIAGIVLVGIAIVRVDWSVGSCNGGESDNVQIGLWRICPETRCSIRSKELADALNPHHEIKEWEIATLSLMSAGGILAIVACILAMSTSCASCFGARGCLRGAGLGWVLLHLLAALLLVGGIVTYAVSTISDRNSRYTCGIAGTIHLNRRGRAFWFGVAGTAAVGLSWLLAVVCLILLYMVTGSTRSTKIVDTQSKFGYVSNTAV